MKEIMGGFLFGGMITWAIFGLIPGSVLICIGLAAGSWELVKEHEQEKAENNWRKSYPPYGY